MNANISDRDIIEHYTHQTADLGRKERINVLQANMSLSEKEAEMAYDAMRDFCQAKIRPRDDGDFGFESADERKAFDHELWKILAENQMLGVIADPKYGGGGSTYTELLSTIEMISSNSGSAGLSVIANIELCLGRILKHATEKQKEEFVKKIIEGDFIGALAMSEAEAGSSVFSDMKLTATPHTREDGTKGFIINGSKLWITNGARYVTENGEKKALTADVLVLYAKTGETVTPFIIRGGTPGFKPGYKISKETMKDSETWELVFEDCFVSEEDILGGPENLGQGKKVLVDGLLSERLALSAGAIGLAQAAIDECLTYIVERKQDGMAIGYNQALAHKIAEMKMRLSGARRSLYYVAQMYEKGIPVLEHEAAEVFLESSTMAKDVTRGALETFGGMGLTTDKRLARLVRDAQLYATGGGTEDIRRETIARYAIQGYHTFAKFSRKLRELFLGKSGADANNIDQQYTLLKRHENEIKQFLEERGIGLT